MQQAGGEGRCKHLRIAGGDFTGYVYGGGKMTSLTIGGSIVGGADFAGGVSVTGEITTVNITGDIKGGSAFANQNMTRSGFLGAARINSLTSQRRLSYGCW